MANKILLDANAVLRYLLCDIDHQFNEVNQNISNRDCLLTLEVIAESIYVLERVYQIPRKNICDIFRQFVREIIMADADILLRALEQFERSPKMDFVDCLMCGYKVARGYDVLTFDKTLRKRLEAIVLPENDE